MPVRPRRSPGVPTAWTGLGTLFVEGEGVARDHAEARRFLARAADVSHVGAVIAHAGFFVRGEGGLEDRTLAADWLAKARQVQLGN